jgi:hypothetical protein
MKLRRAIAIAGRRNSSGGLRMTELYAGATVEGVDTVIELAEIIE